LRFIIGKIGENKRYKNTSWEKFFCYCGCKQDLEGFFNRKLRSELELNLGNLILFDLTQKVTKKSRLRPLRPKNWRSLAKIFQTRSFVTQTEMILTPSSLAFRLTRRGRSAHITGLVIKISYIINEVMYKRKFPNLGKAWELLKPVLFEFLL
jgi:hypothetical protein